MVLDHDTRSSHFTFIRRMGIEKRTMSNIEMNDKLADAICDIDDYMFNNEIENDDPERMEQWLNLVEQASKQIFRVVHAKRSKNIKADNQR